MSHAKQWIVGIAAVLVVSVAASVASAGPLRFAGRVAVRTPVAAVRTAAVVTPPYRPYYRPYYRTYYAPRTYYYGGYGYRPYYYNYGYRPYYTAARPVIYVR
jgi:hypothetical protein